MNGLTDMEEGQALRAELSALLSREATAAHLGEVVPRYWPSLSAFRENDDLILMEGVRRLFVRRVGPDRFRTFDAAAASGSTNLLDGGEGDERDLEGLIDEITAFAAV
jgi:hypothetical protein